MNYDLAKELKDTGFENYKDDVIDGKTGKHVIDIWMPTLSELIGACEEKFLALVKWDEDSGPKRVARWYASTRVKKYTSDLYWGDTPEEAVAKMWLSLNKKT